jgi:diphthamide synthase subunit DPH2
MDQEYNLELERVVSEIKKLMQKTVLLHLPDGLKAAG